MKYIVKLRANKRLEAAINQEIIASFELFAANESVAKFRAETMMFFIMNGFIEDKKLNPALIDEGATIIEIKEV